MGGAGGYLERIRHGQVVGGEHQGARLPGSGGALASRLFAKMHPTRTPKTGRFQDPEDKLGRTRQEHIDAEVPATG